MATEHFIIFCGEKSTEKVKSSLDGGTNNADNQQLESPKSTQVQAGALRPAHLWAKMINS